MAEPARRIRPIVAGAALVLAVGSPVWAQRAPEIPGAPSDSVAADSATGPSPAGAFVRSLLIPGWGQASHGAYVRGGVFFSFQAGSGFMLIKTLAKLAEARSMEAQRVGRVGTAARDSLLALAAADSLLAERYANPATLELDVQNAVDADERVGHLRDLVSARKGQREDWIAMVIFVTLMSGVDALVNAHLSDFPGRVDVEPAAGRLDVGITMPLGGSP